jgi:murein hydrolase activator
MMRRLLIPLVALGSLVGGLAVARAPGMANEAAALALAKRQVEEALLRSERLEEQASEATGVAARARAEAEAIAARIQAAEADITAAEARVRIVEAMRAEQRARLAERQEPVIRLTAALQMMARRPPALALVQPGSLDDAVHVRALLASTLPVIRQRTADLREEVEEGNRLRRQAELAVAELVRSREELKEQRQAFARLETRQRERSANLIQSALFESDRALALGEEARELAELMRTREYQARVRVDLSELPGPVLRPSTDGQAPPLPFRRSAGASPYILPVEGRVVRGMGEISDAGVHARGVTFATDARARIVAPRDGRIAYASDFRRFGGIVIIDHGAGWMTLVTDLAEIEVEVGDRVGQGEVLGRTGAEDRPVTVELRRNGRPFPIAPLLSLAG